MTERQSSFATDFAAGGISAIMSKTVMAPIERVKLLLQTQRVNSMLSGSNKQYLGVMDCLGRVYREQGALSFWRGNVANVVRFFPNHALNFALKDRFKKTCVGEATKETNFWRFFLGNLTAGGAAGGVALGATHPIDILRTKLAADVGTGGGRLYTGYGSCAREVYKSAGPGGFYRGFGVSLAGVVLFKALFMGGYDVSKAMFDLEHTTTSNRISSKSSSSSVTAAGSLGARLLVAQTLTTVVGAVCYPLDTIRRRIMMQTRVGSSGEFVYKNGLHCARVMLRDEGISGLYAGFSANLVRSVGGALLLVGYDEVRGLLHLVLIALDLPK